MEHAALRQVLDDVEAFLEEQERFLIQWDAEGRQSRAISKSDAEDLVMGFARTIRVLAWLEVSSVKGWGRKKDVNDRLNALVDHFCKHLLESLTSESATSR